MEQYWIIARSVTYAQRMEKALAGAGIRTRIFRAPRELSDRGCAYAVELSGGALRPALAILGWTPCGCISSRMERIGSFPFEQGPAAVPPGCAASEFFRGG